MTSSNSRERAIGAAGTTGRILFGLRFIYLAVTNFGVPEWELAWQGPVLGLVAFPAALLLFQAVRLRFTNETLNATGGLGFCLNFAVGAVLFSIPFTREGALIFYGASLLIAAARGYAGCESLAITNWILRRDDQVGCVVFSPLDAVEAQFRVGKTNREARTSSDPFGTRFDGGI